MSIDWNGPFRHVRRRSSEIRSEVDEELRFHLEMRIAELREKGLDAQEARDLAIRQFGDLQQTRKVCMSTDAKREQAHAWHISWDEFRQDVRHGLRQLRRRWQVTLLAALTLGVGIGASTAIFSATDHVLLRPLPYDDADRVVTLWATNEKDGNQKVQASPGTFLDWQKRATSFEYMALAEPNGVDLETDGPPIAIATQGVSSGYFEAIGARPILGRTFRPEEHQPGAERVVMISEGFWQRQYGGDPGIVGRKIILDEQPVTVVGVLPASLRYPKAEDIWQPKIFREDEAQDRYSAYMDAVARLKPGVTIEQARAEMRRIADQLAVEYPRSNTDRRVNLVPLEEQILGPVKPALFVMLGAVAFVLLIACSNVASLLLAAGAERGKELAVRASLGAGRRRLLAQLTTESLLLALIGGAFGLLFARGGMQALVLLSPPDLPRVDSISLDGRVLAFSIVLTLGTAILFGLAPALRFSRPDLLTTLRATGRSVTAGRARHRLRGALVISEVALALVLLIGAGLLMRSFVTLLNNDLGFEPSNRATLQVFLWDRNPAVEERLQRAHAIEENLRTTPGVLNVGIVSALPFHPHAIDANARVRILDRPVPTGEEPVVYTTVASPSYFKAVGIQLVRGRSFDQRDRIGGPPVALINESFARQHMAGIDPIGRQINIGVMAAPQTYEIIGITSDVRPVTLDSEARPEVFVPLDQHGSGSLTYVVHTSGDADKLLPALQKRVWDVDPGQSIYWSSTIEQMIGDTLVARRFNLVLLASFSAIALILATIGIYGLISFATQQRTNEIGVRMALGAERTQIIAMIVRNGLQLALPGIAAGVVGAFALTRFLQGMLYGIRPTDPMTFTQIVLLMIGVAVVAAYIPARRAVRSSPLRSILTE